MAVNENFILTLIDKFSSSNLAELKLDDGAVHIELRKEGAGGPDRAAPAGPRNPGGTAEGLRLGLPAAPAKAVAGQAPAGAEEIGEAITSPIVATFYASPQPDAPAFVGPGSRVKSGDTLCILEAMKMMNHLEAEFDCEILAVKALSGDLVEYGQVLFEVKRL
jgi:acetyl-CoA carboxylase biotin carboxyl carrier protein